jgi:hypothetical protein
MSGSSLPNPLDSRLICLYQGLESCLDIVAVENVGELPLQSWTCEEQGKKVVWLKDTDFLPRVVPYARIYSFGYTITDNVDVRSLGEDLVRALDRQRREMV